MGLTKLLAQTTYTAVFLLRTSWQEKVTKVAQHIFNISVVLGVSSVISFRHVSETC